MTVIFTCLLSAGCAAKSVDAVGKDKVEALRREAGAYESGRYFITNAETNVLEQVFSFMYDSDGTQIYLCEGVRGGEYYSEYSNGKELFREENGVGAVISSDDESFAVYSRKNPHPYSTGQLLFYINQYIDASEEITDEEGNTVYIYYYNVEKMNKVTDGNLTEFATSYAFDADGNFVYFRQHNASEASGENGSVSSESYIYEITVGEVNAVSEIENPVIIGGSAYGD